MAFISDRDKGLHAALPQVFPDAYHSYCCQHLADNIQKDHGGLACQNLFWKAAYAYTEQNFQEGMLKLKEQSQDAYDYLNEKSHTSWSQYAFPAPRFGHITSNIAESINSSWDEHCNKPILQLFTSTWAKVMSTMHVRRHQRHVSDWITDYAKMKIDENYQQAR